MVAKFDKLVAPKGYSWKLEDILPKVLNAGENAGCLTPEGVKRLDVSGNLKAGIPLCPPEATREPVWWPLMPSNNVPEMFRPELLRSP